MFVAGKVVENLNKMWWISPVCSGFPDKDVSEA